MPEPQTHPQFPRLRRAAVFTLIAGVVIMLMKFGVFFLTDSTAVLSDAMESIINLIAAALMLYSITLSNRPADIDHPYGHGKVEFMAAGFEGGLILAAGTLIAWKAGGRLIHGSDLDMARLNIGTWMLGGIGLLGFALAAYVWRAGRKYDSIVLVADGKHLLTDALSTAGVIVGLILVQWTGRQWLDPVVALAMAAFIFWTSWKLLWQSIGGLMDRRDPADDSTIREILDDEVRRGTIAGYHKVRLRHAGAFHWVDMHLQVDPAMTVTAAHDLASRIEHRIEQRLGEGNATAHIEPFTSQQTLEQPPERREP